MTPKAGNPQTFYFDTESNLIVKSEITYTLQTGDITIESYGLDYKENYRVNSKNILNE